MTRLAVPLALLLAACTPAQVDRAESIHAKIAALCKIAAAVAPSIYVTAACLTEAGIAKLALDPDSIEWLQDFIEKRRG